MSDKAPINLDAAKTQKLRTRFARFKQEHDDKSAEIVRVAGREDQSQATVRTR